MSRIEARFSVSGMHCRSCSMMVDMTVTELAGVESSETDLPSGTTKVVFDDAVVSAEQIRVAIEAAGYPATIGE